MQKGQLQKELPDKLGVVTPLYWSDIVSNL